MQQKFLYAPISGRGLGTCYSSLNRVGAFLPSEGIGQAKLRYFINLFNGNLVVQDPPVRVVEDNFPLEFYYTYNSIIPDGQPKWQFSHKQFLSLPPIHNPPMEAKGILQEVDGHLTEYVLNMSEGPIYYCPKEGLGEGTPNLRFDENRSCWIWYHPGTHITEVYSKDGMLLSRCDDKGRCTTYAYQGTQLFAIVGPTGNRYELHRDEKNRAMGLYDMTQIKLLRTYQFDTLGNLVVSTSPDRYETLYQYTLATSHLYSVQQADESILVFLLDDNNRPIRFQIGGIKEATLFVNYATPSQPNRASLIDGFGIKTSLEMDIQGNPLTLIRECGFDQSSGEEITQFIFNEQSQLIEKISPGKIIETFTYKDFFGVLSEHTQSDGQITAYDYAEDTNRHCLHKISEVIQGGPGVAPSVTRYVYDEFYQKKEAQFFLRFTISPEGRVTEYRPDMNGNIASVRHYLANFYPVGELSPGVAPSLQDMRHWKAQQDPQQVTLSEFEYDDRGQCTLTKQYGTVDAEGKGVADETMSLAMSSWDSFGNCLEENVLQTPQHSAITRQSFDSLDRLTLHENALEEKLTHNYLDGSRLQVTTFPNGSSKAIAANAMGLAVEEVLVGDNAQHEEETRRSRFERDAAGRVVKTDQADGQVVYTFYDRQNQLGFKVDPLGFVTEYQQEDTYRYQATLQYAHPIDVAQLATTEGLPLASTLLHLVENIKDPSQDRVSYIFKDHSNRPQYEVEGSNNLTEYRYDLKNRLIGKIYYEKPLKNNELNTLKTGGQIQRHPDPLHDRWWQYFYDLDGNVIAEQDPAGYVTEKKYDAGNRCYKEIRYAETRKHVEAIKQFKLTESEEVAESYFYYNARNQCILEIDAENYVTTHRYYPNGSEASSTRYASALDRNWSKGWPLNKTPDLPTPSTEDQTQTKEYDLLSRPILTHLPFNKAERKAYDPMGEETLSQWFDALVNDNFTEDTQRATRKTYDQLQQLIEESDEVNPSYRYVYDPNGLKTRTINPANEETIYFYNANRQPIIAINAKGSIIETLYNGFREPIKIRKYKATLPLEQLPLLTGGFITPTLRAQLEALQNDALDALTIYARNKMGLVEKIIDPENYVTQKKYNAFKQLSEEVIPLKKSLNEAASYYRITHEYEPRGLEINTTQQSQDGKLSRTDVYAYKSLYGKQTLHVDPLGLSTQTLQDRLGRDIRKIVGGKTREKRVLDAFGRTLILENSLSQATYFKYHQTERSKTITYPEKNSETFIENIFGEWISHIDGMGYQETATHDSSGKIKRRSQQIVGNDFTQKKYAIDVHEIAIGYEYDAMHRLQEQTDPNQVTTTWVRDAVGDISESILDLAGKNLTTQFERDSWGRATKKIDPREGVTMMEYDHRDLITSVMMDPPNDRGEGSHLALLTTFDYNGQGTKMREAQGSADEPHQYDIAYRSDGLNRSIGKIIDPASPQKTESLNLASSLTLDKTNQTIATQDEHGFITRYFYDQYGSRFIVDPEGGITEKRFNTEGDVIYQRVYTNKLTTALNDDTTLEQMMGYAQALQSADDSQLWYFYDNNRRERFLMNSRGAVSEKRYDAANRKIADIHYANRLNPEETRTLSTPAFMKVVASHANPQKDCATYYVLSPNILSDKRLERFTFDPEGYVTEKCFDDNGNPLAEILYQQKVRDPADLATQSLESISAQLNFDDPFNEIIYTVYDIRNNPIFTVYPEGNIIGFIYDNNGNLIQKCHYAQKLSPVPRDYPTLRTFLQTLTPNKANNDRIYVYDFDAANRQYKVTDPEGNTDIYTLDGVGNAVKHEDRNKQLWTYIFDRDKREIEEHSPLTNITKVTYAPNRGIAGQLTSMVLSDQSIVRQKIYNKENHSITEIRAAGTDESRQVTSYFNKNNKPLKVEIADVEIDNPDLAAQFKTRPDQIQTITTTVVYDGKNNPLVTKDESGHLGFTIYDSENNPVYKIDGAGGVIKQDFDAFNQIECEIKYDTMLDINLLATYANSGITLAQIQGLMAGKENPEKDRVTMLTHDRRGDEILREEGSVFYYLPNALQPEGPRHGIAKPRIEKRYTAARLCYFIAKLIDPTIPTYEIHLELYDRNHNIVAKVDPDRFVVTEDFNAFNQPEKHIEFSTALPKSINLTDLAAVRQAVAALPNTSQYICYLTEYNFLGLEKLITYKNVTYQALELVNGIPTLMDKTGDLTKGFGYTATGKCNIITYEDGKSEFIYYDTRDKECAKAEVPRDSLDNYDQPITVIPLTYYGINAHGEQVLIRRFKFGTQEALATTLPLPKNADATQDQIELVLNGKRGFALYKQDPEMTITGLSYTATKKTARLWHVLSNWELGSNLDYRSLSNLIEKRFGYDNRDLTNHIAIYQDGVTKQHTYYKLNAFGQAVGEGPDGAQWPVQWDFDTRGVLWRSNAGKDAFSVILSDLRGLETANLQSATNDLGDIGYADLTRVLDWSLDTLERTESVRSLSGNITTKLLPAYTEVGQGQGEPVPLSMIIEKQVAEDDIKTFMTWQLPQERNVDFEFVLWPAANPVNKSSLTVIPMGTYRLGVDVSQKVTDVYQYELRYLMTVPGQQEKVLLYRTQGSVQFATNAVGQPSSRLVITQTGDAQVLLQGNTLNLQSVELWQGANKIVTLPLNGQLNLDLSAYPSGTYQLKPIYGNTAGLLSLPFTIYTTTLSAQPLAREIDFRLLIDIPDGQNAIINWEINPAFANNPIQLQCDYIGTDETPYSQQGELTAGQSFVFEHPVSQISQVSVNLQVVPQGQAPAIWIPLIIAMRPEPQVPTVRQKAKHRLQAILPELKDGLKQLTYFEPKKLWFKKRDYQNILQIDPQEIKEVLLKAIADKQIRQKLAVEIQAALQSGRYRCQDSRWQFLCHQTRGHDVAREQCLDNIKDVLKLGQKLSSLDKQQISELTVKNETLVKNYFDLEIDRLQIKDKITTYLTSIETVSSYCLQLGKTLPLGAQSLSVYAAHVEKPVMLWQRKTDNPTQLILFDSIEGKGEKADTLQILIDEHLKLDAILNEVGFNALNSSKTLEDKEGKAIFDLEDDWKEMESEKTISFKDPSPVRATFGPRKISYITPLTGFSEPPTLAYLDMSLDRLADIKYLTAIAVTREGIVADVSDLPLGIYPCNVGEQLGLQFAVSQGQPVYPSLYYPTSTGEPTVSLKAVTLKIQRPKYQYSYNAWKNLTRAIDPLGSPTDMTYNYRHQLVTTIEPYIGVMTITHTDYQRPIERTGYNTRGFVIGHSRFSERVQPKTTGYELDAAGQTIKEILANGLVARLRVFDAVKNLTRYQNSRLNWYHYHLDRNGRVTQLNYPSGKRTELYAYNEVGKRSVIRDQSGRTEHFCFDHNYKLSKHFHPLNQSTLYVNDRNGLPLKIKYADESQLTYTRNYFGLELDHIDLSGARIKPTYDYKGQRITLRSSGGHHGTSLTIRKFTINTEDGTRIYYRPTYKPTPDQYMTWRYQAGRLLEEKNLAEGKRTTFTYDLLGRLIKRELYEGSTIIRTLQSSLDALGRDLQQFDTFLTLRNGYDLFHNRVWLESNLKLDNRHWEVSTRYNTFDEVNNVIIDGGKLENGQIKVGDGVQYTTYQGLRKTELHHGITTTLGHDRDDFLIIAHRSDGKIAWRHYTGFDLRNIRNNAGELHSFGYDNDANTTLQEYFKDEKLRNEIIQTMSLRDIPVAQVVTNYVYEGDKRKQTITDNLTLDSVKFDEPKTSRVYGQEVKQELEEPRDIQPLALYYDSLAHIQAINGQQDPENPDGKRGDLNAFQTSQGLILKKDTYHVSEEGGLEFAHSDYQFFTTNNLYLGSCDQEGKASLGLLQHSVTDHGGEETGIIGTVVTTSGKGAPHFSYADPAGMAAVVPVLSVGQRKQLKEAKKAHQSSPIPTGLTFTQPPPMPGRCSAFEGDTPQSIAERYLGSSQAAQQILELNGLTEGAELYAGYPLRLPPIVPTRNAVNIHSPYYQFISKIEGSLHPFIKHADKPHVNPLAVLSKTAILAIAAAVSMMVAQELTPIILSALGTAIGTATATATITATATQAVVAGVTSSLIDIVGQEAMIGAGLQTEFSWQEVANVGVSNAVAGGIDALSQPARLLAGTNAMIRAGMQNVLQQLSQMAINDGMKFDIKSLAVAISSTGITEGVINPKMENMPALGKFTSSLTQSVLANIAKGGKFELDLVAAEALGNYAGGKIGDRIGQAIKNQIEQSKPTIPPTQSLKPMRRQEFAATKISNGSKLDELSTRSDEQTGAKRRGQSTEKWERLAHDLTLREGLEQSKSTFREGSQEDIEKYYKNNPNYKHIIGPSGHSSFIDKQGNIFAFNSEGIRYEINEGVESIHLEEYLLGGGEILGVKLAEAAGKLSLRLAPSLLEAGGKVLSGVKNLGGMSLGKLVTNFGGVWIRKNVTKEVEDIVLSRKEYLDQKFGRAGVLNRDINHRGYLEKIPTLDVSTEANKAIFYSGNNGLNGIFARLLAKNTGRTTIEMTPGGQWLHKEKIYLAMSDKYADNLWALLSEKFANNASGEVIAFAKNADPERVYLRRERPILLNNSKVELRELDGLPPELNDKYNLYFNK